MTQTESKSIDQMEKECIYILIHPSGKLEFTPDLLLITGEDERELLPVEKQDEDGYYTVRSSRNNDEVNVIGGLKQDDDGRIKGKINLSHLSDNLGTCIVVDIARKNDLMFLQHLKPKQKYDPRRTSFITQKEYHNEETD